MFDTVIFADPITLLQGALTGLVFGFLLQKAGLTRFDTIVGQFLLRDHTVLKVMGTAIVVGGLGVYAMLGLGWIESLHVKPALLAANALGGIVFGVGMAILGYCPGTGVAAIGDGARDAIFGVLGMIAGAALYAEVEPWTRAQILPLVDLGKATFTSLTGLSPCWFLVPLGILAILGFSALERVERRRFAHR